MCTIKNKLFSFVKVCVYEGLPIVCTVCAHLQRPEEGVGSLGARVTGACEPLRVGFGNGFWVLCRKSQHFEMALDYLSSSKTSIFLKKGVKCGNSQF